MSLDLCQCCSDGCQYFFRHPQLISCRSWHDGATSSKALVCGDSISFCTILAFFTGFDSMQVFTFFNERNEMRRDLLLLYYHHRYQHSYSHTAANTSLPQLLLSLQFRWNDGCFLCAHPCFLKQSSVPFSASVVSFCSVVARFKLLSLLVFIELAFVLDQAQSLVRSFPLVPFPVFPSCSFPCLSLLFLSLSFSLAFSCLPGNS